MSHENSITVEVDGKFVNLHTSGRGLPAFGAFGAFAWEQDIRHQSGRSASG